MKYNPNYGAQNISGLLASVWVLLRASLVGATRCISTVGIVLRLLIVRGIAEATSAICACAVVGLATDALVERSVQRPGFFDPLRVCVLVPDVIR